MVHRAGLLLAFLLLASACQPAATGGSSSPPSGVAAADQKLYRGDYDGAETAYQKLVAGGDVTAMAHYAILLNYENRFGEAVAMARKAAQANSSSSIALAAETRSLDWSEDVAGALEVGGKAVKAGASDPLARSFYGEALADAGHYASSRQQLLKAESLAHDPYSASEVEREWGNYYRGLGDILEELNHLELSLKAQPQFPERTLELVRYRYAQQDQPGARKLLDGLRKQFGSDYGVDLSAADSAFVSGDNDYGESLYKAALKIQPDGVAASLGEAELLVAGRRDFQGAHDLLTAAFKAHPSSGDVGIYLRYLDELLLPTNLTADFADKAPIVLASVKPALDRVNSLRSGLGLPALAESQPLDQSALEHAYFFLFNFGQSSLAGTKIHEEDPSLPGAVGPDPFSRAHHYGFTGNRVSEVISHVFAPGAAVDKWVDAVYHRYPLSDPESVSAGYGEVEVGALSIQVMDVGQGPSTTHDPVVYPGADQSGVPLAFVGDEVPDPAPGARYPTGYPITIQVGSSSSLEVQTAELVGPDGSDVDGYALDSRNAQLGGNEWGVLPRSPLQPGGRYTMKISGVVDGQKFSKSWSFTVLPADAS